MKLEWLPAALADRDAIYDYIRADSRRAAFQLDEKIEEYADRLIDYPQRGRVGRQLRTRELIIPGVPYIVVYQVEPNRILILRVLHGAQSWPDDSDGALNDL